MLVSVAHAVLASLLSASLGELRESARLFLLTEGTLLIIHGKPSGWIGSASPKQWCSHTLHSLCIHALEAAVISGVCRW